MDVPLLAPKAASEGLTAAPLVWLAGQAPSPLDVLVWSAVAVLVVVAVAHAVLGLIVRCREVFEPPPPDA